MLGESRQESTTPTRFSFGCWSPLHRPIGAARLCGGPQDWLVRPVPLPRIDYESCGLETGERVEPVSSCWCNPLADSSLRMCSMYTTPVRRP